MASHLYSYLPKEEKINFYDGKNYQHERCEHADSIESCKRLAAKMQQSSRENNENCKVNDMISSLQQMQEILDKKMEEKTKILAEKRTTEIKYLQKKRKEKKEFQQFLLSVPVKTTKEIIDDYCTQQIQLLNKNEIPVIKEQDIVVPSRDQTGDCAINSPLADDRNDVRAMDTPTEKISEVLHEKININEPVNHVEEVTQQAQLKNTYFTSQLDTSQSDALIRSKYLHGMMILKPNTQTRIKGHLKAKHNSRCYRIRRSKYIFSRGRRIKSKKRRYKSNRPRMKLIDI